MNKPFIITEIYDKLLRGDEKMPVGLYHLHLLTAYQLTRLHYSSGSYKYVRQNLRVLADKGVVVIDAIPQKFTRGPNIYSLGVKGIQHLRELGHDVDKSVRASKETGKGYQHIEHMIELNDVFIAALRVSMLDPRLYIADDYKHERELKRTPFKTMVHGATYGLVPDGYLDFHVRREGQTDLRLPVYLEHDRGWEREKQFKNKIAAYRAFLQDKPRNITVLVTTFTDMKRVADLRKWTWDEVQNDFSLSGRFRFGLLPRPPEPAHLLFDKRWYTLISDQPIALLEG
jgi:Replication-relaxation